MSEDVYTITFRVTAEFNLPGVYFVEGDLDVVKKMDISLRVNNYDDTQEGIIPMFTIDNLYTRFPPEKDGMQLYGTTIFKTNEEGTQVEDRVDLTGAIDNEHLKVVRLYRSWYMNPHTLLQIIVLKNREQLEEDKDFRVDYNTMNLIVLNPDKTATYRLVIYFNYNTVNEILSNSAYNNVRDVNKLKENAFPGPSQDGVYVSTPSDNPDEMQKSTTQYMPTEDIPEDVENPQIIEEGEANHVGWIEPDYILQKGRVMLNHSEEPERFLHPAENLYPEESVPEDRKEEVAESVKGAGNHSVYDHPLEIPVGRQQTELSPNGPHHHDPDYLEVSVNSQENEPSFPPRYEGSAADVHNSVITDPKKEKKFSSGKTSQKKTNTSTSSGKKFYSSKK